MASLVVPMNASIAGWVVRNNKPVIIHDVHQDPRFFGNVERSIGFATRSILGVPMRFKERVIGVVEALNKREGEFSDQDMEKLTILSAQAAVAIENARLLAELQNAYQELNELDRLKSEFITTTSHELRTPLTAIKGYLQLITNGVMPPEEQDKALQTVSRHIDTVVNLVNDLLLMQELNVIGLRFSTLDLAPVVRAEMEALADRAASTGIRWVSDVDDGMPPVWGDAARLGRMCHNLLDNAIKFSPDGGDVIVRLSVRDGKACLEVRDPGVGIPLEEQEKIFERFHRIGKVGDHIFGGLGLGLAIAKHIVQEHSGHIGVNSKPGKGSTFTVTLPLEKPEG